MYRHRIRENQIINKNYIFIGKIGKKWKLLTAEASTNLKLFQVSVCSALQLVPHGSEIHRMLYDFIIVWKLYNIRHRH